MTDITKLKEVIQAVNPEIMELKFGCELLWGQSKVICINTFKRNERGQSINVLGKDLVIHTMSLDPLNVLGRPIRLADVLLAVKDKDIFVDNLGRFWNDEQKIIGYRWNLKDDDLSKQSEETKQFLIDLLTSS